MINWIQWFLIGLEKKSTNCSYNYSIFQWYTQDVSRGVFWHCMQAVMSCQPWKSCWGGTIHIHQPLSDKQASKKKKKIQSRGCFKTPLMPIFSLKGGCLNTPNTPPPPPVRVWYMYIFWYYNIFSDKVDPVTLDSYMYFILLLLLLVCFRIDLLHRWLLFCPSVPIIFQPSLKSTILLFKIILVTQVLVKKTPKAYILRQISSINWLC